MIGNIHFIRPMYLWLFIPVGILIFLSFSRGKKSSPWHEVCDAALIAPLLKSTDAARRMSYGIAIALGSILTVFALAGPSRHHVDLPAFRPNSPVIIALDLSLSMNSSDLKPSRLERAKYKVMDIFKKYPENRYGLVAFAEEAYVVSPVTNDAETLKSFVQVLDPDLMPIQGSRVAESVNLAVNLLNESGAPSGRLILLTDSIPTDKDKSAIEKALARGVKTSVIAVGTLEPVPIKTKNGFLKDDTGKTVVTKLDPQALSNLAKAGKGHFQSITSDDVDIDAVMSDSFETNFTEIPILANTWRDDGYWLVWGIAILVLGAFRRGWFERCLH